jgi:hypothetical protein
LNDAVPTLPPQKSGVFEMLPDIWLKFSYVVSEIEVLFVLPQPPTSQYPTIPPLAGGVTVRFPLL